VRKVENLPQDRNLMLKVVRMAERTSKKASKLPSNRTTTTMESKIKEAKVAKREVRISRKTTISL